MTAAQAKQRAQAALDFMRVHPKEDARCVGYAWSALAAIAGDDRPAPWERTVASVPAEKVHP
jgi:hypothetical protein